MERIKQFYFSARLWLYLPGKKMISLSWKHPILSSTCNTVTCSTTSFQFHHSCCTYPQFSLHMKACAYQLCICLNFKHKKSFFFFFFLFFCGGGGVVKDCAQTDYKFITHNNLPFFSPWAVYIQIVSDGMVIKGVACKFQTLWANLTKRTKSK